MKQEKILGRVLKQSDWITCKTGSQEIQYLNFYLNNVKQNTNFNQNGKEVNKSSKCPDKNNFVLTWVIRANNIFGSILPRKMSYNPMHIETSSNVKYLFQKLRKYNKSLIKNPIIREVGKHLGSFSRYSIIRKITVLWM